MIKKTKQETGELIFGVHPVLELLKLKRRKLISIYTTKPQPKAWPQIERLLPKYPINIQYVPREVLHKMAGTTDHQNLLAWAQPFPYRKQFFQPTKEKFLLMLDGIQDPRNLGAIIRSAYCTGVDGVIIIQQGAAPLTASAIKSSAGLAERMDVFVAPSALQAAKELQKAGYTLYLAAFGGDNAATFAYQFPLCLVIGSEGEGISKEVLKQGTQITIPQRTKDISYNASVAAGILLFVIAGNCVQK
ncbi:MAG TPA: RNA methyltransferase [Candidatus Limnocylindria bacterium]|nr:RNA methyltransferase [Candidatus Limnocylindria bacterium]